MTAIPASGEPVHALLTDGTTVSVRPAGPADQEAVLRLYTEMSDANLRLRFFSSIILRSALLRTGGAALPVLKDLGYFRCQGG